MPPDAPPEPRHRSAWSSGDLARVLAGSTTLVGELLCEAVLLKAGERVLDVGTGTGNTAISAARRRTKVVGIDFVPALIERARVRAKFDGFTIRFEEGDAESLPFADASFDAVLSTFGVMFAPDQTRAAREMLRVVRPGGRIGLANWTPESFQARQFALLERFAGEPSSGPAPSRWGTEDGLRALFPPPAASLAIQPRIARMRSDSPAAYAEFYLRFFGPAVRIYEALDPPRKAELMGAFTELVASRNRSGDATVLIPSDYLEVVITRA